MAVIDVAVGIELPQDVVSNGVVLYQREAGDEAWKRLGVFEGDTVIEGMTIGQEYEIGAALIDGDGNPAAERDWDISPITPLGMGDAPPAPTDFTVVQDGEFLDARWKDVAPRMTRFSHYELRVGSAWAGARRIVETPTAFHRWKWETDAAIVIRIATIDEYNHRSAEATYSITVQPLADFVTDSTLDEDGGGFAGTKTDVEVDTGDLILSDFGNPADTITIVADTWTFSPWGPWEGTYEGAETDLGSEGNFRFEPDIVVAAGDSIWDRVAEDLNIPVAVGAFNPNDGAPRDTTDESTHIKIGDAIPGGDEKPADVFVEFKCGATPGSGTYAPFLPGFYRCRYYRFRVRLRSWNRYRRDRLSQLRFKIRKKNLKDEGQIAVVATPGPTPVTFATTFIDPPTVTAIIEGSSAIAVRVNSVTATGCNLTTWLDDGTEAFDINDTIHWHAMGT
jgi:hypothetical protein